MEPMILESGCEWTAADVADPATWTEVLTAAEIAEIDAAVAANLDKVGDLVRVGKADFPLPTLGPRLNAIEQDLMEGRGFALIRGLPRERYSNDEMCLAYWGIGTHLGRLWPQNRHGHLLGDVTDQGKSRDDTNARGYQMGTVGLEFHTDPSDIVGLICLQSGVSGGRAQVCNSVTLHNKMVRERPDLAAELYKPQPYDMRGEEADGERAWYEMPVFANRDGHLFVRIVVAYMQSSQRHDDAPRLTEKAKEAMAWITTHAESGEFGVEMDLLPGDMQFINNNHVLHGRTPYTDDRAAGRIRHLKRLWLETDLLADRPAWCSNTPSTKWSEQRTIGRLDAVS